MLDNEAAIRVIITGHNPNMRHMSRTQRIDISALNERYHGGDFTFVACPSQYHQPQAFEAGDILTKACTDAKVWGRNLMSIGHFRKGTLISSGMLSAAPALPVCLSLSLQPGGYFLKPAPPPLTRSFTKSLVREVSRSIALISIRMHRRSNAFTLGLMEHLKFLASEI